MRRFLTFFLIFAFMVSIFDILDVNDILLGNQEVFSTENSDADNDADDLSEHNFTPVVSVVFVLPAAVGKGFVNPEPSIPPHYFKSDQFTAGLFIHNLYRPPIGNL